MKRTKLHTNAKKSNAEKAPKVYDRRGLNVAIEVLRELLSEAETVRDRMQERGVSEIAIPPGSGSEAYDRARNAIAAWTRGLRSGLYDQIEDSANGTE